MRTHTEHDGYKMLIQIRNQHRKQSIKGDYLIRQKKICAHPFNNEL